MIASRVELRNSELIVTEATLQKRKIYLCIGENLESGQLRLTHAAMFPSGVYEYDESTHKYLCNPGEDLVDEVSYRLAPAHNSQGYRILYKTRSKPLTRLAESLAFVSLSPPFIEKQDFAIQFCIDPIHLPKIKCEMPF